MNKLFYYCNINTNDESEKNIKNFAERRKVLQLKAFFESIGLNVSIYDVERKGLQAVNGLSVWIIIHARFKYIFEYLKTAYSILAYSRRSDLSDKHCFYNLPVYTWPAFFYLLITRRPIIIDVEDYPGSVSLSIRSAEQFFTRWLLRFRSPLKISASSGYMHKLAGSSCLYYGPPFRIIQDLSKYKDNSIIVHFGGYISEDTGINSLIDLIHIASRIGFPVPVKLLITGTEWDFGDLPTIKNSSFSIEIASEMPVAKLNSLLKQEVHVGLSLKVVNGRYDGTTFPSKLQHYWESGVLVLATPLEDLKANFGGAYIPVGDSGKDIYDKLVQICACGHDELLRLTRNQQNKAQSVLCKHETWLASYISEGNSQ